MPTRGIGLARFVLLALVAVRAYDAAADVAAIVHVVVEFGRRSLPEAFVGRFLHTATGREACDPEAWTWVDGLQIVLYLWLHEARLIIAACAVAAVDFAVAWFVRLAAPGVTAAANPAGFRRAALQLLATPLVQTANGRLPQSWRLKSAMLALALVVLGVDLTTSLERFAAFSMQRPLHASTPHPQWTDVGPAATAGRGDGGTATAASSKSPSWSAGLVVPNAKLECELADALVEPGLVIVSGPRLIGKSTIVRRAVQAREGFYCDVSAAASPEGLEDVLRGCAAPHMLLTIMWAPLANVARFLSLPVSAWMPFATVPWLAVISNALALTSPRQPLHDVAVSAHLPACFDDLEGAEDTSSPPFTAAVPPPVHSPNTGDEEEEEEELPMVVVLDGVRDLGGSSGSSDAGTVGASSSSSSSTHLGSLEGSTEAMRFIRRASRRAVVVLVAASDQPLGLTRLLHSELTSTAARTILIAAAPSDADEAAPLYRQMDASLVRHGADAAVASAIAACAASAFGGSFELAHAWVAAAGGVRGLARGGLSQSSAAARLLAARTEWFVAEALGLVGGAGDDGTEVLAPDITPGELGTRLRTVLLAAQIVLAGVDDGNRTVFAHGADPDARERLTGRQIAVEVTAASARCAACVGNARPFRSRLIIPSRMLRAAVATVVLGRRRAIDAQCRVFRDQVAAGNPPMPLAHSSHADRAARNFCSEINATVAMLAAANRTEGERNASLCASHSWN